MLSKCPPTPTLVGVSCRLQRQRNAGRGRIPVKCPVASGAASEKGAIKKKEWSSRDADTILRWPLTPPLRLKVFRYGLICFADLFELFRVRRYAARICEGK